MSYTQAVIQLAPFHIKRKQAIAEAFAVSPATVTAWAKQGAPIFIAGNKYQADYHALVDWLNKNRPACKTLSTPPLPPQ